jgi:hypothetical protein
MDNLAGEELIDSGRKSPLENTIISIIGSKKSGKTTFGKSLISFLGNGKFPIHNNYFNFITKNKKQYIILEGLPDIVSIATLSKISDVVVILIDGFFGLELEIFEFMDFIKTDKKIKVFFAATHLDLFKNWKSLKKAKKRLKDLLLKQYNFVKIFFIGGINIQNRYYPKEIENITRFLFTDLKKSKIKNNEKCYFIISKINFLTKLQKQKIFLEGHLKGEIIDDGEKILGYIPGLGNIQIKKIKMIKRDNIFNSKNTKEGKKYFKKQCCYKNKGFFFSYSVNLFSENRTFLVLSDRFYYKIDSQQISLINTLRFFGKNYFLSLNYKCCPKNHQIESNKNKSISKQKNLTIKGKPNFKNKKTCLNKEKKIKSCRIKNFKLEIGYLPATFKRYFNLNIPMILVILRLSNQQEIFLSAKILKHKWNKEKISSGKICLFSIGWHLFRTKIYIYQEISSGNFKLKKFLSNYQPNQALFYSTAQVKDMAFIGISYNISKNKMLYRGTKLSISFTGYIRQNIPHFRLFTRVSLSGKVYKNFKKTAFITGMFVSEFETIKFIGSHLISENGSRGIIKGPVKNSEEGSFRVTFEDKIEKGQTVFLKLWHILKPQKILLSKLFSLLSIDIREVREKFFML